MWYTLPESNKQYPLTIERVKYIKSQNKQNIFPDELEAVEIVSSKPREVEPSFVDVVGQISLRSLERADKKRKQQNKPESQNRPKDSERPKNQQRNNPGRNNFPGNNNTPTIKKYPPRKENRPNSQ